MKRTLENERGEKQTYILLPSNINHQGFMKK